VAEPAFGLKGGDPAADRIFTVVNRALLRGFLALVAVLAAFALTASAASAAGRPKVLVVHFSADINPVTQDFVNHQIDRANNGHYSAVVILLDTPGGLSTSMEKIFEKELASKVPVIVYVSPQGAGAASAGVFVAEAADILAMAPATNIGSSTPIDQSGGNLGSDLRRKVINHFAAKLRALASTHGRNAKWADAAVRKASNLTATEALKMNVIDLTAPDLAALLNTIDGRTTKPKGIVLHTANAELVNARLSFFQRVLNTLIDPTLITLLFLAGLAGIGFEIFHPGVVLPGALGAVALVTALFGFSILPISWGGLLLLILGIVLLVIDAHVTSHGAISVAGLTCLVVGSIMLFRNAPSPYHTSVPLVLAVAGGLGAFWAIAITKAIQVRRRPPSVGPHELLGAEGEVRREGLVFVRGELWQAQPADSEPLRPGDHVRVESVDGLVLTVRHAPAAAAVS
jgi:membrane-bound serine protease (ClpP class)